MVLLGLGPGRIELPILLDCYFVGYSAGGDRA